VRIDHVQERLLDGSAILDGGSAILDGVRAAGERGYNETGGTNERERRTHAAIVPEMRALVS